MNREAIDGWLERGVLAVALLLFVSLPLLFGGAPQKVTGSPMDFVLVEPWVVVEVLTLVLLGIWLVRLWIDPKPRLLIPPITWAVLAFAVYAVGRYWTADIEYVARQEVLRIVIYAFVFLLVLNNLHRQESTQWVGLTMVGLATLLSFYAVYQFLADSDRVWHLVKPYSHRGSGTFISPNHLGGFLEMVLPLALAYSIMGKFKVLPRVALVYASVCILAGIVVTMSRGTWLATLVALVVFFIALAFHRPYRIQAAVALGLLLVGGAVVLPSSDAFKTRVRQLYSGGKLDDDARFALWKPAVEIWKQNPVWGAGPGHFDHLFKTVRPEAVQSRAGQVHNDFLNTLADYGVAGAALVGSAWLLVGAGALKTWRRVKKNPRDLGGSANSTKAAFVLGSTAGLVAIFAHSAVDFNMHIPANALLAITWMALLSSYMRFATDNFWFSAGTGRKLLVSVLLAGGLAGLGWQSWKRAQENFWLTEAGRKPVHTDEHLEALKHAFRAENRNPRTAFAIGEALRRRSAQGTEDYRQWAEEALVWYGRALQLNPWDASAALMSGWCLDWLGRTEESGEFFERAERLDPNSYFTTAHIGLHYVETGNWAAAKPWFERSLRLRQTENPIAENYLELARTQLLQSATNSAATAPAAGN